MSAGRVLVLVAVLLSACAATGPSQPEPTPPPGPEEVARLVAEGDEAVRQRRYDDALVKYVLAIEGDPDSADIRYRIGIVHREQNELVVAKRNFEQALKLDPEHMGTRVALGLAAMRDNEHEKARELLQSVVERESNNWRALNALGVLNDLQAQYAPARVFYDRALVVQPDSTDVLNNYGYSYYLEGRWLEAQTLFERIVKLNPRHERAWSNLALVYLQLGEETKAKATFERLVPEHKALNNVGYFELLRDRPDVAKRRFDEAAKTAPTYYPVAQQNLASLRDANSRDAAKADRASLGLVSNDGIRLDNVVAQTPKGPQVIDVASLPGAARDNVRPPPRAVSNAVSSRDIRFVQQRLASLGYDPGPADGASGKQTEAAVRQFQVDNSLRPSGAITATLVRQLR